MSHLLWCNPVKTVVCVRVKGALMKVWHALLCLTRGWPTRCTLRHRCSQMAPLARAMLCLLHTLLSAAVMKLRASWGRWPGTCACLYMMCSYVAARLSCSKGG